MLPVTSWVCSRPQIVDGDKAAGAVAYWGVENAEAAFKRIIELGATVHEEVQDVGEGIKVATGKDPFGNIFGIIENPHFKIP